MSHHAHRQLAREQISKFAESSNVRPQCGHGQFDAVINARHAYIAVWFMGHIVLCEIVLSVCIPVPLVVALAPLLGLTKRWSPRNGLIYACCSWIVNRSHQIYISFLAQRRKNLNKSPRGISTRLIDGQTTENRMYPIIPKRKWNPIGK